ncbi:hypothetical protein AKJ45_03660 [candidate division MSBL1 archaeon SCGC-AAA261F19]|uniref:Uncharacterized protein n=1 Tax=candidate division MSBL1 archaeon SCGC-AAA261F19 TaxID=1698275 RepID=A0A133V6X2_9EURY|nr:hypothetical protein AKJ45_03660 [candidate division MSBL1 archaeon SCGC-AAA261F19]
MEIRGSVVISSEKPAARVYSFDLKFTGGKRTRFYRKLSGYSSKTIKEDKEGRKKVYQNTYPGILTPIPHVHLGRSVIAVPQKAAKKLDSFFEDPRWTPRELHSFDAILPSNQRLKAMNSTLDRIELTSSRTLREELNSLLATLSGGKIDREDLARIRKVLRAARRLMEMDWSENREFSKSFRERLAPLKKCLD